MAEAVPATAPRTEASGPTRARIASAGPVGIAAGIAGVFALTLLAIRDVQFVSDDFYLLVGDLALPLLKSHDELHRPLRNALFKLLGRHVGVEDVLPYRALVAASYVAVLALLFRLVRRLGARRPAAAAAACVLAVYPRNHEVLFWFAAWQDVAAGIGVLLTCLFFLEFRRSGRRRHLALASGAYAVTLGLKETGIVLPALVLLIDLYAAGSMAPARRGAFWRAYAPLAAVSVAFVAYFLVDSGMTQLTGHKTAGYYGFGGLVPTAAGVVRALLNIALPFSPSLGFRSVGPLRLALLLLETGLVLLLVSRFRAWRALLLAAAWMVCALLPTAAFASILNADRYLFVPFLGAAVLVGLLVDASGRAWANGRAAAAVWGALAIYAVAGVIHLRDGRRAWKQMGDEAAFVIAEATRLGRRLPPDGEIAFVNVTQGLANGLDGALRSHGLPPSIRLVRNVVCADCPGQAALLARMEACAGQPGAASVGPRLVLVEMGARLVRPDPGCALPLIEDDLRRRPHAWQIIPGR